MLNKRTRTMLTLHRSRRRGSESKKLLFPSKPRVARSRNVPTLLPLDAHSGSRLLSLTAKPCSIQFPLLFYGPTCFHSAPVYHYGHSMGAAVRPPSAVYYFCLCEPGIKSRIVAIELCMTFDVRRQPTRLPISAASSFGPVVRRRFSQAVFALVTRNYHGITNGGML